VAVVGRSPTTVPRLQETHSITLICSSGTRWHPAGVDGEHAIPEGAGARIGTGS